MWLIVKGCDRLGSQVGGWVAGADLVPWFVAQAVQAYGDRVLIPNSERSRQGAG